MLKLIISVVQTSLFPFCFNLYIIFNIRSTTYPSKITTRQNLVNSSLCSHISSTYDPLTDRSYIPPFTFSYLTILYTPYFFNSDSFSGIMLLYLSTCFSIPVCVQHHSSVSSGISINLNIFLQQKFVFDHVSYINLLMTSEFVVRHNSFLRNQLLVLNILFSVFRFFDFDKHKKNEKNYVIICFSTNSVIH